MGNTPNQAPAHPLTSGNKSKINLSRKLGLVPGEPAQCCRLLHCHGPVVHFNPASSLETAQRGVDALPGASDLMRELFLAQIKPDDAIVTPCLAEQHLRDAARQVQEDQV